MEVNRLWYEVKGKINGRKIIVFKEFKEFMEFDFLLLLCCAHYKCFSYWLGFQSFSKSKPEKS